MKSKTGSAVGMITMCTLFSGSAGCAFMSEQTLFAVDAMSEDSVWDPFLLPPLVVVPFTAAVIGTVVVRVVDEKRLDEATGKKWYQHKTLRDYLTVALTSRTTDIRRLAVLKIMGRSEVASEWVFDGLEGIARQDSSATNRWLAVQCMFKVEDSRRVRVALALLSHEQKTDGFLLPDDRMRWACLLLLDDCCHRNLLSGEQTELVRDVMIHHLGKSYHHGLRYAAAKGLRHFADNKSRTALTCAVKDGDVGVELCARRSLQWIAGPPVSAHNQSIGVLSLAR